MAGFCYSNGLLLTLSFVDACVKNSSYSICKFSIIYFFRSLKSGQHKVLVIWLIHFFYYFNNTWTIRGPIYWTRWSGHFKLTIHVNYVLTQFWVKIVIMRCAYCLWRPWNYRYITLFCLCIRWDNVLIRWILLLCDCSLFSNNLLNSKNVSLCK